MRKIKWTHETLRQEALKYKSRSEFQTDSRGAYKSATRNGILDEVCQHMFVYTKKGEQNPRYVWTTEMLEQEALEYQTRTEFARKSYGAYSAARKRKLLDQICKHMKRSINVSSYEHSLFDELKRFYPKVQALKIRNRTLVPNKPHIHGFDIDAYVPERRKGIEFDGDYWHSVKGLRRSRITWPKEDLENYHQIKDDYFKSKGIEILHVKEEDWLKDKQKCIQRCLEFLGGK